MTKTNEILPWVPNLMTKTFTVEASSNETRHTFVVKKVREGKQIGRYAGYYNDQRISTQAHEFPKDAKGEVETFFYSLPQFAGSGQASVMAAIREIGAADFDAGISVIDGAKRYEGASRENWLNGWLMAYASGASDKLQNRLAIMALVFQFAIMMNEQAADVLRDFAKYGKAEQFVERWPEWTNFVASTQQPPAKEAATHVEP